MPLCSHSISRVVNDACFTALLDSASDVRSRALAVSSAIPHAGDWLNIVPSSSLGLHLLDCEFRPCLRYWLGLRMFEDGTQCPVCHVAANPFEDHHVGCGGNGDRIFRHNALRDAGFSAAQSAALVPRREVPSLIPISRSRPADIFLPSWVRGQPAALDVTLISTMQPATINGTASTQGHALLVGEVRKLSIHEAACTAVGVSFVPIVMKSLGGMSALAVNTLEGIGHLLARSTIGDSNS